MNIYTLRLAEFSYLVLTEVRRVLGPRCRLEQVNSGRDRAAFELTTTQARAMGEAMIAWADDVDRARLEALKGGTSE